MQRRHVFISGRVQGVYYRLRAQETAVKCGVTGWVRNLRDGRVEAVFEGKDAAVEEMLSWCRQGPPAASVERVEVVEEPYQGEFTEFFIRPTV